MAIQPEQIAREAAAALDAKQAENIRIYDVRGVSNLTDITVVATGTSGPHLKA
jgi:ribosome-associated protein